MRFILQSSDKSAETLFSRWSQWENPVFFVIFQNILGKVAAPLSKLKNIILISTEQKTLVSRTNGGNSDKSLLEKLKLTTKLSQVEQTKHWKYKSQDKWFSSSWSSHQNLRSCQNSICLGPQPKQNGLFSSIIFNNLTTSCPDLASETFGWWMSFSVSTWYNKKYFVRNVYEIPRSACSL